MFRFLIPLGLAVLFTNPVFAQAQAVKPAEIVDRPGLPSVSSQKITVWTLADSVKHALNVAPEMRAAEAEIVARGGDLSQAGKWPNPTLDVRADNRLGMEDGRGGVDISQVSLSQTIPLRRLAPQQAAAQASLESAQASRNHQRLLLEREIARVYHALQLATAKRQLAEERHRLVADSLNDSTRTSRKSGVDRLVRYLTPLERRRIVLLSEEASLTVVVAERELQKARLAFRALLALVNEAQIEPVVMALADTPADLHALTRKLDEHPALQTARKELEAKQSGVAVVDAERFADPTVTLYREGGYIAGERRDSTGLGVSMQIPFWNSSGSLVRAKAEAESAQARLELTQRDVRSRVIQPHTQLLGLLEQAERIRVSLIEPAREIYTLTRQSFAVGELNVLTLVDAYNIYFDALARYLEVQHESLLTAADLRLASGVSILESSKGMTP